MPLRLICAADGSPQYGQYRWHWTLFGVHIGICLEAGRWGESPTMLPPGHQMLAGDGHSRLTGISLPARLDPEQSDISQSAESRAKAQSRIVEQCMTLADMVVCAVSLQDVYAPECCDFLMRAMRLAY